MWLLILLSAVQAQRSGAVSCGFAAVYTILRLEGRAVNTVMLDSLLPHSGQGNSLAELRDAAQASGLELVAVQLGSFEDSLDRPIIVHMKGQRAGHFVVLRRVGAPNQRMVQVIDPLNGHEIVDVATLCSRPEWTGLALIPKKSIPNYRTMLSTTVILTAIAASSYIPGVRAILDQAVRTLGRARSHHVRSPAR